MVPPDNQFARQGRPAEGMGFFRKATCTGGHRHCIAADRYSGAHLRDLWLLLRCLAGARISGRPAALADHVARRKNSMPGAGGNRLRRRHGPWCFVWLACEPLGPLAGCGRQRQTTGTAGHRSPMKDCRSPAVCPDALRSALCHRLCPLAGKVLPVTGARSQMTDYPPLPTDHRSLRPFERTAPCSEGGYGPSLP